MSRGAEQPTAGAGDAAAAGDAGVADGRVSAGAPWTETRAFADLDPATAYECWRLRQDVFVVEQDCAYPDLDGRDTEPGTRHVLLWEGPAGAATLVGCLRVLDERDHDGAGLARIGRVVLRPPARGRGLAGLLMRVALAEIGDRASVLDAQAPLARWYAVYGYEVAGPEFVEDGIPHLPMRREVS